MSELSRLRWLCRRGMKELDVILSRYLEQHYETASAAEQDNFKNLLEMQDPDLFRLLMGRSQAENAEMEQFIQKLRQLKKQV